MFNDILTAFRGFFSRAFWFGSFLPVAVIAALHLAITAVAFPGPAPTREWLVADLGNQLTGLTVVAFGLIVLAYALSPFTPLVRGFLDGRLMPDWLHDALRRGRVPEWRDGTARMREALAEYEAFHRMNRAGVERLREEAAKGDARKAATDVAAISSAEAAVGDLQREMWVTRIPRRSAAQDAIDLLAVVLATNATNLRPGHSDEPASRRLGEARSLLISLIREARAEATYRFSRMAARYNRIDILATRVGDARRLAERYSGDAYHVEFDYLWSRIQLHLPTDDSGFPQRLSDAQSQVNFAVLAVVLTLTIPVVWLPVLLATATTPWLFLAIGALSPAALFFFYEQLVQSQFVFGEVVRVAIDRYRLEVLTDTMRQPLPQTLAAERALWERLKLAGEPGNAADFSYAHPDSSSQSPSR
jgi:hypothetical protein